MSESKSKILTAASELFAQSGASGLSVRAISNRAGLSTIGIYNHFQGKQGILDALYIEGFELVMQAISINDPDLSPRDAVLKGLANYIDL
ncbi:MAG: TetR family transcriptional regulator, partial [Pseudomonadota bacterium]